MSSSQLQEWGKQQSPCHLGWWHSSSAALLSLLFYSHLWLYQDPCMLFFFFFFGLWSFFCWHYESAFQEQILKPPGRICSSVSVLCLAAELCCGGVLWETFYLVAVLPNLGGKPIISVLFHNSLGLPGNPLRGGREGTKGRTTKHLGQICFDCADCWNMLWCVDLYWKEKGWEGLGGLESPMQRGRSKQQGQELLVWEGCGTSSMEQLCSLWAATLQLCMGGNSQLREGDLLVRASKDTCPVRQMESFVSLNLHLGLWSLLMQWN